MANFQSVVKACIIGAFLSAPSAIAGEASVSEIIEQLNGYGCKSNQADSTYGSLIKAADQCLRSKHLTQSQRASIEEIRNRLVARSDQTVPSSVLETLAALQSQINQLKSEVTRLSDAKNASDQEFKTREASLNQTIGDLKAQLASTTAMASQRQSDNKQDISSKSVATPDSADDAPPKEAPKYRPTLTISGSANLVLGGVTGPNDSLSTNFWNSSIVNINRAFSNESVELMPKSVTGATNKAGGNAFAYYKAGQSNQFYPPNGLIAVDSATASNYAVASSWTGGKVKFTTLSRGGNLIISDKNDPNYDASNPKTLDKSGYQLSVNLKGQPVLPNSGLGGLKNPVANFKEVSTSSFYQSNLGSDITFAGVPLARSDMQALIDLGNASRSLKLGNRADKSFSYTAKAGDTISTVANANGTSAARLLTFNKQLPPSVAANTVLKQGTKLNIPDVGCVDLCQGLTTISRGGLVENTTQYDDLLNMAVAEYGSLTTKQQSRQPVLTAAQAFIRSLSGSSVGDSIESEDFNFQRSYTFNNDVKVHFRTSFTGTDLINISLRYRNILPYGERGRFPALNMAYGFGSIESTAVNFDRLWWKIPLWTDGNFWIGTRYKDYDMLPVQYGTFYPVEQQNYFFASGAGLADYVGSGVGLTLKNIVKNFMGGNLHLGGGYLANPVDALNPVSNTYQQKGIAGRDTRFRAPVQLGYVSNSGNVIASLNYVYSRGDTLNSFVGTNLAANPFFYDVDSFSQIGATLGWQFTEDVSLNLVYNNFIYNSRYDVNVLGVPMAKAGDTARAQSWMAALVFTDLLVDNSTSAIAIGQVPYVYSNQSAWGTNSAPLAFEAWYNYPFSDRVFIQPAIFFVTNHDGFSNGGTDWGSTLRVYLNF